MGEISLTNITKKYGQHVALDNLSLTVRPGEFLSILGPSGSGKSTILKLIAGFEAPEKGTVWLDSENVTNIPANRRNVNTVFQNYALFPHMTVRENIAYPLLIKRTNKAEIAERVDQALKLVELQGVDQRLPEELSGGQRQRAALARALIGRPRVLLLDEPLSALDRRLRIQMQEVLLSLHAELGLTFVFVTHDQSEAMAMSDRVALIMGGHLVDIDTPAQLYWRPKNRQVAAFLGQCNLVEGVVEADGTGFVAREASLRFKLQTPHAPGPCVAAIRAESLSIGTVNEPSDGAATVSGVVFHGATFEVKLDAGVPLVAQHPASISRQITKGQVVQLKVDVDGVCILQE